MSITTRYNNKSFFIRFTSDLISHCDLESIQPALQLALANGARTVVLSIVVGSLSNQRSIARILRKCRAITLGKNAGLYCVVSCQDDKDVYRSICDPLHIPYFYSEEEIPSGLFAPSEA
jgi:hypothetical protein